MARPHRISAPGLVHHVTARGNSRRTIYLDDVDRHSFLNRLALVLAACRIQCLTFCLMSNHYHLIVRTVDANLSRAMQRLNGAYARWWNHRHADVGHLFQGRFASQIIRDDAYLATACRYVVLNPVRAGLVATPADWPWSSYRALAGLTDWPSCLSRDPIWRYLGGGSAAEAAARYRHWVDVGSRDGERTRVGPAAPPAPVAGPASAAPVPPHA